MIEINIKIENTVFHNTDNYKCPNFISGGFDGTSNVLAGKFIDIYKQLEFLFLKLAMLIISDDKILTYIQSLAIQKENNFRFFFI